MADPYPSAFYAIMMVICFLQPEVTARTRRVGCLEESASIWSVPPIGGTAGRTSSSVPTALCHASVQLLGIMTTNSSQIPILPLGTSLVPGGLELTFGIPFVSIIISAFLTGILTLQIFKYYNYYSRDPRALKIIVGAIYVFDLAQFASIVDFTWWYLVRNWGNITSITVVRISYGLAVLFATPVIFGVQLVYVYRIYRLSPWPKRALLPLSALLCLVLLECAFGFRAAAFGLHTIPFTVANHERTSQCGIQASDVQQELTYRAKNYVVGLWLGSGAAADVGIASALVYNLVTRRTGFKRTDTLITKLVVYSINTAAFTSVIAVVDIICFYAMPTNNVHLGLNMLLCKFFSNSLLASLNTRDERRHGNVDTDLSASLNTIGVTVHKTMDTFSDSHTVGLSTSERSRAPVKEGNGGFDDGRDIEMFPVQKTSSENGV
ncbi:hypothetical protein NM688_g5609 [Phlebia brevispora]|uniref:Uncharacterized protein n=1 Tax=Phlebia brevispora TaxID=194682 RepID=A0ACC1SSQ4_9APHY|nr:hypothetical protein NM688_g5609 [Phlebia brevispora]